MLQRSISHLLLDHKFLKLMASDNEYFDCLMSLPTDVQIWIASNSLELASREDYGNVAQLTARLISNPRFIIKAPLEDYEVTLALERRTLSANYKDLQTRGFKPVVLTSRKHGGFFLGAIWSRYRQARKCLCGSGKQFRFCCGRAQVIAGYQLKSERWLLEITGRTKTPWEKFKALFRNGVITRRLNKPCPCGSGIPFMECCWNQGEP